MPNSNDGCNAGNNKHLYAHQVKIGPLLNYPYGSHSSQVACEEQARLQHPFCFYLAFGWPNQRIASCRVQVSHHCVLFSKARDAQNRIHI